VSVHWFLRESRCDHCPKPATADERRKTQIPISHFSVFICGFCAWWHKKKFQIPQISQFSPAQPWRHLPEAFAP